MQLENVNYWPAEGFLQSAFGPIVFRARWQAGLFLLFFLCRADAAIGLDELRKRIEDWPAVTGAPIPRSLTSEEGVQAADLAQLINLKVPQDLRFRFKLLTVLQALDQRDDGALAKVRQLVETQEKAENTERIEELATDYYLKHAPQGDAAQFISESMSIFRPRGLGEAMEWIPAAADSGFDREACVNLGHRALRRFGLLAETHRFSAQQSEFSPMMLFKFGSLFFDYNPEKTPFFGQRQFDEGRAESFVRALAHPKQFNPLGIGSILNVLRGLEKENPAALCGAFQQRIAASTLPQRQMLLYYFFRQNWQQLEDGKELVEWVKGQGVELARLAEQLGQSKLEGEKVEGAASDAMRGVFREMGMEAFW